MLVAPHVFFAWLGGSDVPRFEPSRLPTSTNFCITTLFIYLHVVGQN